MRHKFLNFEKLDQIIQDKVQLASLPKLESVRVTDSAIRFDKLGHSLIYNCKKTDEESLQWGIEEKAEYTDEIPRKRYTFEDNFLLIENGQSYFFDSDILQVECHNSDIAVRTKNNLYICSEGIKKAF